MYSSSSSSLSLFFRQSYGTLHSLYPSLLPQTTTDSLLTTSTLSVGLRSTLILYPPPCLHHQPLNFHLRAPLIFSHCNAYQITVCTTTEALLHTVLPFTGRSMSDRIHTLREYFFVYNCGFNLITGRRLLDKDSDNAILFLLTILLKEWPKIS